MGGGAADRLSSPLDSVTTSREIVDGLSCLTSFSIEIPGILSLAELDVLEIRARAYSRETKGSIDKRTEPSERCKAPWICKRGYLVNPSKTVK